MAAYRVVLPRPEGYPHWRALLEVANGLRGAIRDLGHLLHEQGRWIVVGPHLLAMDPRLLRDLPGDAILYDLEQYADWGPLSEQYPGRELWTHRPGAPGAHHVLEIGWHETLDRIRLAPERDIDVLFYGSVSERRARILQELEAEGAYVVALFGVYGRERDDQIARSKVVLNLHYEDGALFESVRCSYPAGNGALVVSERGPGDAGWEGIVRLTDDPVGETLRALEEEAWKETGKSREAMRERRMEDLLRPLLGEG